MPAALTSALLHLARGSCSGPAGSFCRTGPSRGRPVTIQIYLVGLGEAMELSQHLLFLILHLPLCRLDWQAVGLEVCRSSSTSFDPHRPYVVLFDTG